MGMIPKEDEVVVKEVVTVPEEAVGTLTKEELEEVEETAKKE